MEDFQKKFIEEKYSNFIDNKKIINLDIPDIYQKVDPKFIKLLKEKLKKIIIR